MLSDLPSSCLHTGMATRRMARLPAQQQSSSAGSLAAFPHEKATAARRHTFNVAIGYTAWGANPCWQRANSSVTISPTAT